MGLIYIYIMCNVYLKGFGASASHYKKLKLFVKQSCVCNSCAVPHILFSYLGFVREHSPNIVVLDAQGLITDATHPFSASHRLLRVLRTLSYYGLVLRTLNGHNVCT